MFRSETTLALPISITHPCITCIVKHVDKVGGLCYVYVQSLICTELRSATIDGIYC